MPYEMARRLGMSPEELVQLHTSMVRLIEASRRAADPSADPVPAA